MISSGLCLLKPPATKYFFDIFPGRSRNFVKFRVCLTTVGLDVNLLRPGHGISYVATEGNFRLVRIKRTQKINCFV
jgi:hypothetical protein